jgi:hypothetical protein
MTRRDELKIQLSAYANEITRLEGQVEQLKLAKRALQMEYDKLEPGELVVLPYKGPREASSPYVVCKSCNRKTRRRTKASGLLVAQCLECAYEELGPSIFSAAEQPEAGRG